jgi:hypothetical protein
MVIDGPTPGHAESKRINFVRLRAILDSAYGFHQDDKSDAAVPARAVKGWGDFDQLRFVARVGIEPPQAGYGPKNNVEEIITPERQEWRRLEQVPRDQLGNPVVNGGGAAPAPTSAPSPAARPGTAIARPQWAE